MVSCHYYFCPDPFLDLPGLSQDLFFCLMGNMIHFEDDFDESLDTDLGVHKISVCLIHHDHGVDMHRPC